MTNQNELTHEEQRALNVKNTLESKLMQDIVGGNHVKKEPFLYGQLSSQGAEQTYRDAKSSEDFNKKRQEEYNKLLQQKEQLGIAEEPSYSTDYHVVAGMMTQLQEVQAWAKLSELEEHAKNAGADLDFEIPEELKEYSYLEIVKNMEKEKRKEPTEKEKHVLGMHQLLTKSYERACALKAGKSNYFADINQMGKQIADVYKSKKEE